MSSIFKLSALASFSLLSIITTSYALPSGCVSVSGYSPTTGVKCDSENLPSGCTATTIFSPVTGVRCSATTVIAPSNTEVVVSDVGVCTTLPSTLSYGMTDQDTNGNVTKLQTFLKDFGYLSSSITTTGSFGVNTRNAVKTLQRDVLNNIPISDINANIVTSLSDRQTLSSSSNNRSFLKRS